ncbi:ParB/RepB/Spo0J family partition protein [Pseudonocardia sp. ICBG601]|uniref:ParB/RepB/Spo0J family partition protein n=1 Tax=Pseudonocardia sp. ICBG601 TaxID=2846759 RepID=UPI001CF64147|nr:ParB/RepB/Spo0J family partition protein [Pseudonocardia sp. ICBG601]
MPPRRQPGLTVGAAARIGRRASGEGASSGSTATATATATAEAPQARAGILGAISAAAEQPPAPGERIVDVDVAHLTPHPDNIRDSLGDVTGLGESIAERGVLQPLVVVSRAAFTAQRSDVELDVAVQYVIVAGHRRHAGAVHTGVPTVPVVVRDALAGDDDAVLSMIVENVQRTDLSPIEQARAFGRLRDRGWSERRIAKETGVSPGQVHKRLQLLRLPAKLAAALVDGELTVTDALRLLELPDSEISSAWSQAKREEYRGINGVVTARLAALAARERGEQLRTALTAAGLRLIDDPDAEFGSRPWNHLLPSAYSVPGADPAVRGIASGDDAVPPPADVLAHVYAQGERLHLSWYSTQAREDEPRSGGGGTVAPAEPSASSGSGSAGAFSGSPDAPATTVDPAEAQERAPLLRERQERAEVARAASEARAAACARIVTGRLDPELAVEILADAVLVDVVLEPYEYAAVAAEFCGQLVDEDVDAGDDPVSTWLHRQATAGPLAARRAAVAVALAEVENSLGWAGGDGRDWTSHEARHVRRLAAHGGYELTSDDEQRLAVLTMSASAGSAPADGATS